MSLSKMLSTRKLSTLMLTLLLCACSHAGPSVSKPQFGAEFPPGDFAKAVARVNGKEISAAELKRAKKILLANKPGLQITPALQTEFERHALNQLINSELLFQESQKLAIQGLEKQAESRMAETRNRFATADDYAKSLQDIGMDEQDLRQSVRRDLAIAYLVNTRIVEGMAVSDEEVKRFYDDNPDKFHIEAQVRASHLLIGVDATATPEKRQAAREKAEQLRGALAAGADFAALAQEHSTCPSGKRGGDLGYFGKGKLDPQFEQAAFALRPGDLSEVVETKFGFHVIKVAERKETEVIPIDKASGKIRDHLKAQKTNAAVELFVGETRKNAKVEILL